MFDRAKERSVLPSGASDEAVRNYLKGVIESLIPKIKRNYKTAIPMYFIEEKRIQLLLPWLILPHVLSPAQTRNGSTPKNNSQNPAR
jgi:hypothetical protein